jgi:hypothetical protein
MKQVILQAITNVCGGGATLYAPINAGSALGWAETASGFGEDKATTPWSGAGTFSNLVIHLPTALGVSTVFTLRVNGVSTALTVSLGAAATDGSDTTHSVSVSAGDRVSLQCLGTNVGIGKYSSISIRFTGSVTNQSVYTLNPFSGSVTSNPTLSNGRFGGAFGNGVFQQTSASTIAATLSNTYSIAPIAGTITRLDTRIFSGAPGTSVWTAYLRKNGVTQDGAGGTVNTSVVLTAATVNNNRTFSLSVAAGDHVDVVVFLTVADAAFAVAHVGASIAFTATADDEYVFCGGDNDTTSATLDTYMWNDVEQLITTEANAKAPIGPYDIYLRGLYIERGAAPGAAKSWVSTVRNDGVDTALAVTITGAVATSGSATGSVLCPQNTYINLSLVPSGTPTASQLHWGVRASTGTAPIPPVPTGATFATRRVRRFPHVSDKQNWLFWDRLQIDIQAGVGLASGQGSDPQIMLRYSDDGGQTWSHERWQSAGAQGKYRKRAIWKRLGRSRDRVFELVVTDPVKWVFLQALALLREGRS